DWGGKAQKEDQSGSAAVAVHGATILCSGRGRLLPQSITGRGWGERKSPHRSSIEAPALSVRWQVGTSHAPGGVNSFLPADFASKEGSKYGHRQHKATENQPTLPNPPAQGLVQL